MVVSLHPLSTKKQLLKNLLITRRKRTCIEINEKIEIACVDIHIEICVRHEDESKGKRTILTMKSLILAQDER